MRGRLRIFFYLEAMAALIGVALLALTLVWRNWIEIVFGVDPDRNSGLAELAVIALCVAIALACSLGAGWEWRRAKAALGLQVEGGGSHLG
jgi:apolipoprotein N-acyltransferase